VWQPENFKDQAAVVDKLAAFDLFVVVAYNHILPTWLIELPTYRTLNVHPSLLPKYRGPSPIRSAILADDKAFGVSVMLLDEKMDHGPLIAQTKVAITEADWPIDGQELDTLLVEAGGTLLTETIPQWIAGTITPQEQEHVSATYTKKFSKVDGELAIDPLALPSGEAAYERLLQVRALAGVPGTYFMYQGKRAKVTAATIENDTFVIERVIPEGKSEQTFTEYLRSLHK
jgi:methionyl-tRNA formyltransferase